MSLSLVDYQLIQKQHQAEMQKLEEMLNKQDRQIALLESIVSALENRQDDGR